jgi:hypothetical protein
VAEALEEEAAGLALGDARGLRLAMGEPWPELLEELGCATLARWRRAHPRVEERGWLLFRVDVLGDAPTAPEVDHLRWLEAFVRRHRGADDERALALRAFAWNQLDALGLLVADAHAGRRRAVLEELGLTELLRHQQAAGRLLAYLGGEERARIVGCTYDRVRDAFVSLAWFLDGERDPASTAEHERTFRAADLGSAAMGEVGGLRWRRAFGCVPALEPAG